MESLKALLRVMFWIFYLPLRFTTHATRLLIRLSARPGFCLSKELQQPSRESAQAFTAPCMYTPCCLSVVGNVRFLLLTYTAKNGLSPGYNQPSKAGIVFLQTHTFCESTQRATWQISKTIFFFPTPVGRQAWNKKVSIIQVDYKRNICLHAARRSMFQPSQHFFETCIETDKF